MRLLDVHQLKLKEFPNDKARPPYAILSHTWGDGEVSFQDLSTSALGTSMPVYTKIKRCCEVAIQDGFEYVWIDTCCIDKTSSAELSEAINSMYLWYQSASVCYAYLSDMESGDNPSDPESSFSKSRWFTRGWTLQELLAPKIVLFYDREWAEIGTKRSLQEDISRITGIPLEILINEAETKTFSIAQRMSWASKRETTRVEDIAYCLMGIFDVNMPPLYGEGRKAFIRLQHEIMKGSDDDSLFAWVMKPSGKFRPDSKVLGICDSWAGRQFLEDSLSSPDHALRIFNETTGLLSSSPRHFEYSGKVRCTTVISKHPFSMTNKGLHIWLPMVQVPKMPWIKLHKIRFNCHDEREAKRICIFVTRNYSGQYSRIVPTLLCYDIISADGPRPEPVELYVNDNYLEDSEGDKMDKPFNYQFRLAENSSPNKGYILLGASSAQILQQKTVNLLLGSRYSEAGIAYIIIGAKHDPSVRYLVTLGVIMLEELRIFYNVRADNKDIEEAIATIDKYGNNQPSAGQFRNTFEYWLKRVYIGERIVEEFPSGHIISINFRKGPESSDEVQICRLIVELATPPMAKHTTLIC